MSETTDQDSGFVQKIIWGAITFSLVIFLGLALFGVNPSEEQMADMANNATPMIFFGIGLMEIGLAVFLMPKLLNAPENPKITQFLLTRYDMFLTIGRLRLEICLKVSLRKVNERQAQQGNGFAAEAGTADQGRPSTDLNAQVGTIFNDSEQ